MTPALLRLLVSLPWLAALLVLLAVVKLVDDRSRVHWELLGSAMICFSIGCLARTTLGLHGLKASAPSPPADPQP
ncbi:MAG: hypothetical protein ACOYLI_10180 [Synechococcus lacustris]|jgi:hypothetical protein